MCEINDWGLHQVPTSYKKQARVRMWVHAKVHKRGARLLANLIQQLLSLTLIHHSVKMSFSQEDEERWQKIGADRHRARHARDEIRRKKKSDQRVREKKDGEENQNMTRDEKCSAGARPQMIVYICSIDFNETDWSSTWAHA